MKGRYIVKSICLISDILEYTDISVMLFSADFEKAFDSIGRAFLFVVLELFEFVPQFIQWVRVV